MNKPLIAIDLDDVLADSTETIRRLANKRFGVELEEHHYRAPGEYWSYYETVWKQNGLGDSVKLKDLDVIMETDQSHVLVMKDAQNVLSRLNVDYSLAVVSARSLAWHDASVAWLETHFPGIFEHIIFADGHEGIRQKHKGAICKEIGANWLIDDSVDHARDALDEGLTAIVFGEYGWQYKGLPDRAIACRNWNEIARYFGV